MARADNSHHLDRWRKEQLEASLERVRSALDRMAADGEQPTFASVAKSAGVSRSWLYTSPFADEIRSLRTTMPAQQRRTSTASDESLKVRLTDALDEVARLRAENKELSRQLELALGQRRNA